MLQGLSAEEGRAVAGAVQGWLQHRSPSAAQRVLAAAVGDGEPRPLDALASLSPAGRRAALEWLLVTSCFAEALDDGELETLEALNRRLGLPTRWPTAVRLAKAGHRRRATMQLAKWAPDAKAMLRVLWRDAGFKGVLSGLLSSVGKSLPDRALAERYAALEALPPGSLGHAFFTHMRTRKLSLPGEPGGLPEAAMHHDLMHVLTGFDTDARGEGRLAAVYAGLVSRHPIAGSDAFAFVLVGLLTFHLGFQVGPTFVGAERGVVSPSELLALLEVGKRLTVNVITDWRFTDDYARPLTEVRERLGLPAAGALPG